ncbi:MAG: hypothetical protein ACD_46C00278G0009 [uncultured bacterium]|nr:MAG: hypothetical protein ACD_46C00278G0009 [uncultured bacterium]
MATSRLNSQPNNQSVHTKESILKKLDSDMTDTERQSFINNLVQSFDTALLLNYVALEWKMKLLEKKSQLITFEERVRVKNIYIGVYNNADEVGAEEKIRKMKISLHEDAEQLKVIKTNYEVSTARAEKSLALFAPIANQLQQMTDNAEPTNQLRK